MRKTLVCLVSAVIVLSCISGCQAKRVKVCATIYPVMYLIERIGGNRIDSCMISDNTQITRAQASPSYKNDVKGADIVFYVGDLEPFMAIYANELQLQKINLFDVTANSRLYDFRRYTNVVADNKSLIVESDYYDYGELFRGVDMYGNDPYVWLDAIAYTSMAKTITDYLVKSAPLDKDFFLTNFNEIQFELVALDSEFQTLRELGKPPRFVALTPSFGNWQKSYGIELYPVMLSKFGVLPNEKQLEVIEKAIKDSEVKYLVAEPGLEPDQLALLDHLEKTYKLKRVILYNLSFITVEQQEAGENYFTLMQANLDALLTMVE